MRTVEELVPKTERKISERYLKLSGKLTQFYRKRIEDIVLSPIIENIYKKWNIAGVNKLTQGFEPTKADLLS